MEQAYRSILVERDAGVATLTLNRPERMNVLNSEALGELDHALRLIALDEGVRAVVFRSASERAFTAGADIREMRGLDHAGAKAFSELGHRVANRLEREAPPVVMAANGYVMGGGVELACACDFRIASEDAVFCQPEINIGVLPGWGGTQRLARVIGLPRARELIYTGRKIDAQEALGLGLVHAVVPKADLRPRATALAAELASKSRPALMACKRAVNAVTELPLTAGLEFEQNAWAMLFGGEGQIEGMAAFLEHREPRFQKPARESGSAEGSGGSGT